MKKVKDFPNVSYGLVLLSPDNSVCFKEKNSDETKYYASQTVIFELGFLLGKLGKQNVVAVYLPTKGFEIPTQYQEIRWVEYKSGWYFKLINELKEANYNVDANKLSWI